MYGVCCTWEAHRVVGKCAARTWEIEPHGLGNLATEPTGHAHAHAKSDACRYKVESEVRPIGIQVIAF
jgi:hypothetical protein